MSSYKDLVFPEPDIADHYGMVAIGGELSVDLLLTAYSQGVFPWPDGEGDAIAWYSPHQRMVLFPEEFKLKKSLKQTINKGIFEVKRDTCFEKVISQCSTRGNNPEPTWITTEMQKAYIELYYCGFAHSYETFFEGQLVGGLYGISLGKAFFGESMFHTKTDASKVAFAQLVKDMKNWGFDFIDAQLHTPHLESLGAREIPRDNFIELLHKTLEHPSQRGKWSGK